MLLLVIVSDMYVVVVFKGFGMDLTGNSVMSMVFPRSHVTWTGPQLFRGRKKERFNFFPLQRKQGETLIENIFTRHNLVMMIYIS